MTIDIIQHHEAIDFDALFKSIEPGYIGRDYNDLVCFFKNDGEKHSFIGISDCGNRVECALEEAIASDPKAPDIFNASAAMIMIMSSKDGERPLLVEEIMCLNGFVTRFSNDCDVTWGIFDDSSLGNSVKVVLMVALKD